MRFPLTFCSAGAHERLFAGGHLDGGDPVAGAKLRARLYLSRDWGACAGLLADLRQRGGGEFSGQPAGGYCQHAGCHVQVGAEIADGELEGRDRRAARPEHRYGYLEGSGV